MRRRKSIMGSPSIMMAKREMARPTMEMMVGVVGRVARRFAGCGGRLNTFGRMNDACRRKYRADHGDVHRLRTQGREIRQSCAEIPEIHA